MNFKGNNLKPENHMTSLAMMKQMHIPYYIRGRGWYCHTWEDQTTLFLGKNKAAAVKTLNSFE
jgi:hypothetical protein